MPRIATSSFPYNFTPIWKYSCYLVVLNGLCEYLKFQENEKEKKLETVTKESPLKAHHKVYLESELTLLFDSCLIMSLFSYAIEVWASGCKENHFCSLPFGQAEASNY